MTDKVAGHLGRELRLTGLTFLRLQIHVELSEPKAVRNIFGGENQNNRFALFDRDLVGLKTESFGMYFNPTRRWLAMARRLREKPGCQQQAGYAQ